MYSNKFAAKLVNIKELCKYIADKLRIIRVLSTYYLTFRFPSLIMEKIEKKYEIRSFYLDGRFYSMAIFSQNNKQTEVDFRKYCADRPNKVEPFKLPCDIEEKLERLFRYFDLNCGSIDIIVDKNGKYVFLEINPVGQFQMTSIPCNYNIEQIIANYLVYGTQENNA